MIMDDTRAGVLSKNIPERSELPKYQTVKPVVPQIRYQALEVV